MQQALLGLSMLSGFVFSRHCSRLALPAAQKQVFWFCSNVIVGVTFARIKLVILTIVT
jgi:hypothetical protein